MMAFSSQLENGIDLISKNGVTCVVDNNLFKFPSGKIRISSRLEDNSRGMGGFIGADHEYFLYCSQEDAQISFARLSPIKKDWEGYRHYWLVPNSKNEPICFRIWSSRDNNIYLFSSRPRYRQYFTEPYPSEFIQVNLENFDVKEITSQEFLEKRHTEIGDNSRSLWKLQTPSKSNHENKAKSTTRLNQDEKILHNLILQHLVCNMDIFVLGHFSPSNQKNVKAILQKYKANIALRLSEDVDIAICGRTPSKKLIKEIERLKIRTIQWNASI
ncbi:hypothetical protein GQ44DRAFT_317457 [Phaeosphaeriaceae sp. PMI808]|nr:hypothetical protein GQ44DRAFT_317457 [Phaeosphaeriaceae sp. PMI808]